MRQGWRVIGFGAVLAAMAAGCQEEKNVPPVEVAQNEPPALEPYPEEQVPPAEPQPAPAPMRTTPAAQPVTAAETASPPPVDTTARAAPAATASAAREPRTDYAPPPRETGRTHVVRKNETLQKISMHYYGTTRKWRRIYEANASVIRDPDVITPGMRIRIP